MLFAVSDSDLPWVVKIIQNALRGLCADLCQLIYPLISTFYQVFSNMGKLFYNDNFTQIYTRISTVIGVFMVFRVIFWLIELLVSPDSLSDKEKNPGKIIQKVLLSIVLLATTPRIFKLAFNLQYDIMNEHVIEDLIVLESKDKQGVEKLDNEAIGRKMAAELFLNFYKASEYDGNDNCKDLAGKDGGIIYSEMINYNKMSHLTDGCLTDTYKNGEEEYYKIDFNGLFAVGVGAFVFWMILMYCISVGTRYVQLIFLQIIAPIPIMCYLTPKKDNMFSKWVKQCTTTYLDLFIRVSIISFVMLLINQVFENSADFGAIGETSNWIILFLVLGLLTFAKKAPDLIQELLPKSVTKASGDFGLSWKKRTEAMLGGKLVYGASKLATAGVATGAVTGAVGFLGGRGAGRLTGLVSGAFRGLSTGAKKGSFFGNMKQSVNKQQDVNKRKIDWANNGSTWSGRMQQRFANALGYEGKAETYENQISEIDNENAERKRKTERLANISKEVGNMESRARSKLSEKGQLSGYGGELQRQRVNYAAINTAMKNGDKATAQNIATNEYNRSQSQIEKIERKINPSFGNTNIERMRDLIDNKKNLSDNEKEELARLKEASGLTSSDLRQYERARESKAMAQDVSQKLYDDVFTSADSEILQNQVNKTTEEDYVSGALEGEISDAVIDYSRKNIEASRQEILQIASEYNLSLSADEVEKQPGFEEVAGLFEKVGDHYKLKDEYLTEEIKDYSLVDKLKSSAKATENDIQYQISEGERRKADIQASEEYKASKSDRDAVGGHSGKK